MRPTTKCATRADAVERASRKRSRNAPAWRSLLDRSRSARGVGHSRVGTRRRCAHPWSSAHLAGSGGLRRAACAPGRFPAAVGETARALRPGRGHLLRTFRRRLRPLPYQLRFLHRARESRSFARRWSRLADLVAEFGGSLSGEHGDGLARSELLPKMFGAELIGAFREFKQAFDPDHRMNPGVIVDPEPLDAHLRIGAELCARRVPYSLRFQRVKAVSPAPRSNASVSANAARPTLARCARRTWRRATRCIRRVAVRGCCYEALTGDLLIHGFSR